MQGPHPVGGLGSPAARLPDAAGETQNHGICRTAPWPASSGSDTPGSTGPVRGAAQVGAGEPRVGQLVLQPAHPTGALP